MTIEDIIPLNGRLVIEVLPDVNEYTGTLHVASPATKEPSQIALIKTLPEEYNADGRLSVGQRVIFNRNSGVVVKLDKFNTNEPEYRLIKPEDIHALIN